MKNKAEIEVEWIDMFLLAAIIVLGAVVAIFLLPMLPSIGLIVWHVCLAVLRFWRWPSWIYTIIGVLVLCGLLWISKRTG
jgi:hypothetical protein